MLLLFFFFYRKGKRKPMFLLVVWRKTRLVHRIIIRPMCYALFANSTSVLIFTFVHAYLYFLIVNRALMVCVYSTRFPAIAFSSVLKIRKKKKFVNKITVTKELSRKKFIKNFPNVIRVILSLILVLNRNS